jgi:hypothetical protein
VFIFGSGGERIVVGILETLVFQHDHHAGSLMIENMAVQQSIARVGGVELHLHRLARRHQYGVPRGAAERLAIDFFDLEDMAMQVHRVGHTDREAGGVIGPRAGVDSAPCARTGSRTIDVQARCIRSHRYAMTTS